MPTPPMNPALIANVIMLYEKPYSMSAGAIAERLRLTKNQVSGLLHRAAKRGEVVLRRDQEPGLITVRGGGVRPYTPLPEGMGRKRGTPHPVKAAPPAPAVEAPAPLPPPPLPEPTVFRQRTSRDDCKWPTSNGRPWTFCCAKALVGRPYCEEHLAVSIEQDALRRQADRRQIRSASRIAA